MNDCIFCKIIKKEIPAEIIHEDETSISFLDINPVNEGHLLIIPKEHYPTLTQTPDALVSSLFLKAKELLPAVQKGTNADFVVISIVGIDVLHLHIHLIPRYTNDGMSGFWPTKKYESFEKMKTVGEKIRKEIKE